MSGRAAVRTAPDVALGGAVQLVAAHPDAGADETRGTADDLYTYDLTDTGRPTDSAKLWHSKRATAEFVRSAVLVRVLSV